MSTSRPVPAEDESVALGFGDLHVEPGAHVAHFYQTGEEQRDLLTPFLATGLDAGDICLHMPGPGDREELVRVLDDAGVDVEGALASGQLHLEEEYAEPEALRHRLSAILEEGVRSAARVRWSGDMTWALDRMEGSRELMRWESACNRVDEPERVVFFCQYSLTDFPGTVVMDALKTHSTCVVGRTVRQNSLFVEPERFLERLDRRPQTRFEA